MTQPPSRRGFPLWLAALPAAVITIFFVVPAIRQFSGAALAMDPTLESSRKSNRPSCVETYGITLNSSEYFVREWALGIPAPNRSNTPELSTVLRGMARNGCGEDLKNVHIRFVVHDHNGHKGDGYYLIETLAIGEAKPFERAWMGRVTSYEITTDR